MKRVLSLWLAVFLVSILFAQKSDSTSYSRKSGTKNKAELHDWIIIGANMSSDVIGAGFYNEITASVSHKFDAGIGTAFEIMELAHNYKILKIPVCLVYNFHFDNNFYLTFRPSFVIPYDVKLFTDDYSKIPSPLFYGNPGGRTINDPNELLKTGIGVAFGVVWNLNDEITFQLLYQNQPSCLYEPYAARLDFFSARFGVILK
ncbi:MAG: hypothetical protein ACHQK8_07765 [Bacteroidia bacterium]